MHMEFNQFEMALKKRMNAVLQSIEVEVCILERERERERAPTVLVNSTESPTTRHR
jgi:hypothetical protein